MTQNSGPLRWLWRTVDPAFAAERTQLARWEVQTQAQARASRNSAYAERILAGLQKLELAAILTIARSAIWNDLLPVLQEARKNRDDFFDVAIEYQRVLPLLRVEQPDVFLDSYWGELWILNILLDSRIVPVVEAARLQAPEPAVVEQIFQETRPRCPIAIARRSKKQCRSTSTQRCERKGQSCPSDSIPSSRASCFRRA